MLILLIFLLNISWPQVIWQCTHTPLAQIPLLTSNAYSRATPILPPPPPPPSPKLAVGVQQTLGDLKPFVLSIRCQCLFICFCESVALVAWHTSCEMSPRQKSARQTRSCAPHVCVGRDSNNSRKLLTGRHSVTCIQAKTDGNIPGAKPWPDWQSVMRRLWYSTTQRLRLRSTAFSDVAYRQLNQ